MADNMTPEQRSRTMARIRSKNTGPELLLRRALFRRGLRYRLHPKNLPGKPDIVFPTSRVAVFVDGNFWHGWDFPAVRETLQPYWREKIERNMRRDREQEGDLTARGWEVLRFWEHEVKADPDTCAKAVEEVVRRTDRLAGPK